MSAYISVLAVIAGLLCLLAARKQRGDIGRLRKFDTYARSFHTSVQPLLSDDETPVEVLDLIGFMNAKLAQTGSAREFLRLAGRARAAEPLRRDMRDRVEIIHRFFHRRSELKPAYVAVLSYALLAMSYRGGRLSGFILRLWLINDVASDDIDMKPRSESLLTRFQNGQGLGASV